MVNYTVMVRPSANKELQRLPLETQHRIAVALRELASNPRPPARIKARLLRLASHLENQAALIREGIVDTKQQRFASANADSAAFQRAENRGQKLAFRCRCVPP